MASYSFVSSERTRCPPAKTTVHYGASGLALTEPSVDFDLIIRQQPDRARVCTSRGRDRRNVDPPPIIQLKIREHGSEVDASNYLQNPYFFMCCVLVNAKDDRPCTTPASDCLSGTIVSSLYRLKDVDNQDGGFFVFGDISLRMEGVFRLKFSLFEVRPIANVDFHREVCHIRSVISQPFQVYSAKNFPGMSQSTFLSRSFSDQGVRIRIRKESRSSSRQTPRGTTNDSRSDSGDRDSDGNDRMDTEEQQSTPATGYGRPPLDRIPSWSHSASTGRSPQARFASADSYMDRPRSPGNAIAGGRDWPARPRPGGYHPYAPPPPPTMTHQSSSASSYASSQSQVGSNSGATSARSPPEARAKSPFWNQPRDGRDLSSYSLNRGNRGSPQALGPMALPPSGLSSASAPVIGRPDESTVHRTGSWARSEPPTPMTGSSYVPPGPISSYPAGPHAMPGPRHSATLPSPVSPAFSQHYAPGQQQQQQYQPDGKGYSQYDPRPQLTQRTSSQDIRGLAPMHDGHLSQDNRSYNYNFPRPEITSRTSDTRSAVTGDRIDSLPAMPPRADDLTRPPAMDERRQDQLPPPLTDHLTTKDVPSGKLDAKTAERLTMIKNKQAAAMSAGVKPDGAASEEGKLVDRVVA